MTHVRSLRFEILEGRQFLSTAHVAAAHATPAFAPALVLNGTLTLDNNPGASTIRNGEGEATTSVPVAGQLGTLGQVDGTCDETVHVHGDHAALDELILRNAKGSIIVAFTQPAHTKALSGVSFERTQVVWGGTGVYAGATERGSVEVTTNAAGTQVVSLTLQTRNT
jgi:hypothetical protein